MDGSSQVVSEGTLVFIRPDDAHCYKVLNCDDFEFVNVNIAGEPGRAGLSLARIPQESFDRPKLPPSIRLLGAQHEEMQRKFLELSRMSPGPERRRSFCALIPEVLLLLFTRADMERTPVMPPWLTEVLQKLDESRLLHAGAARAPAHDALHAGAPDAVLSPLRAHDAHGLHQPEAPELRGFAPCGPEPCARRGRAARRLSQPQPLLSPLPPAVRLHAAAVFRAVSGRAERAVALLAAISRRRGARLRGLWRGAHSAGGGLFAHYASAGRTHIFLSLERDVSEDRLAEVFARWDPR